MTSNVRFRVNRPQVISEKFDDEVVFVNLDSGSYYSLDGCGAELWDMLEQGRATNDIVEVIAHRYEGDRPDLERAVYQFVDDLLLDKLLVPVAEPFEEMDQSASFGVPTVEKLRFAAPVLHKFTDMQELLLLDPIHEVDETGWPTAAHAPAEARASTNGERAA